MPWMDMTIFGLYMAGILGIGYFHFRRNRTEEDYYVGGRDMPATCRRIAFICCAAALLRSGAAAEPGRFDPDPDPVQGLAALHERQGHKPWDLYLREDDQLLLRRTVFKDRRFGTTVWMIDDTPANEFVTSSSIYPAWNANASRMYLPTHRPGPDGVHRRWFTNADFSRLLPNEEGVRPFWDPANPDVYIRASRDWIVQIDIRTGERRELASWDYEQMPPYQAEEHPDFVYKDEARNYRFRVWLPQAEGGTLYALPRLPLCVPSGQSPWTPDHRPRAYFTSDSRFIFLATPHGGMWTTYEGDPFSQYRPERRHRHAILETAEFGNLIRIRPGILIDRETGEMEKVIAPADGHRIYREIYQGGGVNFPSGGGWDEYRVHTSDDPDELLEIFTFYPLNTHGHWDASPDREYLAMDGGNFSIYPMRGGEPMPIQASPSWNHYHLHWSMHPRFLVGWIRGWNFSDYSRPLNANIVFQVFTDGTFQPIVDTKHRVNSIYHGADFTMQSPDATKIHYGSNMTGRFKNYVALMSRPRPPVDVNHARSDGVVHLKWEPSAYSRETRGYYVYRSRTSGDGYELQTAGAVSGLSWTDETAEAGMDYFYVVTSVEHSGFESGYSAETAAIAGPESPVVVYIEAESGIRDLYTDARPGLAMGADRAEASDGYYAYLHPEAELGRAVLTAAAPRDGSYIAWLRLRGAGESVRWRIGNGTTVLDAETDRTEWVWVRAGGLLLEAGSASLTIETSDPGAQIDLVCLATDARFTPAGPRPEKTIPPQPVGNLSARNIRSRVNLLAWERPGDPTLSHYQVYSTTEGPIREPRQELLIGSPVDEEMADWGLASGTLYHYAVTAIDRRGNESVIATAQAETPAAPQPEATIRLLFDQSAPEGPFEQSMAGATQGTFYLVPEAPEENAVAWDIDLPHEGGYYIWLRALQRGSGRRLEIARHNVDLLLDGERVAVIGGGATDLNIPDALIEPGHPLAPQLWTWAPLEDARGELLPVELPSGRRILRLANLAPGVRYDVLVLTSDPSWQPGDGRLLNR